MPVFLVKRQEQIQTFFNTQLERLETDYIDYYLMHMLDSLQAWEKLKDFGILNFIRDKKASGQIRYIGFSFHGRPEEFIKILEDYEWDFCQIQYNYLDEYNQAGLAGLKRAYELEIGVVLSAMNVDEHIKENIEVANITTPNSMSDEESKIIDDVKVIYRELMKVPCTGCNYYMSCPFGVDIPGVFIE